MTVSQPPASPPAWQPPPPAPPRPPLTPREKSGARLAGIVGFLLLTIGYGLLSFPVAVLAFGAFFVFVAEFIRRVSQNDAAFDQFMSGLSWFDPAAWILPLVVIAIVGAALMAGALFASARILRTHDIARPWAVTWSGAGIAIVGSWFLSGLSALPFGLAGGLSSGDTDSTFVISILIGVLSLLIGLATTAVIGWLSWWWMAHAFRRPAV